MRKIHKQVNELFEPFDWKVEETEFSELTNKNNETIFALGNGYLGVRGTFEEGFYGDAANTNPGTFINGIYEYHDYHYIWCRPGFPSRYHSIVNQVDAFEAIVSVGGERIYLDKDRVTNYKRMLDMKNGILTRCFDTVTAAGIKVHLNYERFVSMDEIHTTAMKITVTPSENCEVGVISVLDGEIKCIDICDGEKGIFMDNSFDLVELTMDNELQSVTNCTKISKFTIVAAKKDKMLGAMVTNAKEGKKLYSQYIEQAKADIPVVFERVTCYGTNRDDDNTKQFVRKLTDTQFTEGYEALKNKHIVKWNVFWQQAGVDIKGDTVILQGMRFALYHLNQSTGRDGITNISANGLTGVGYQGHTFWDTEIFMMPLFLYTQPETVRKLLIYRYNILDKARERARQMDDQGALFSWNSINGEECGHVFEAVTAQYHINTDIYYAIHRYVEATGDKDFLVQYGAEILFEISKCMAHRGSFIELKNNQFCINVVCGPDEYTPIVDNNCYTNWLCRKQFYYTLETAEMLKKDCPEKYRQLLNKCGVDDDELALWKRAADNMYIPYHKELDIYMQDDQLLYRDPIDIEAIPPERLPLLHHLHPLNLWRYRVIKQADLVLLTYLCSNEFTDKMKKKIFDFYEPLCIHDSSLSAGIHSIVACDVGYGEEAYGYFRQAARMDLDNVNRNTFLGVHSACMGNTWMILVNGYAGMRLFDGMLHFKPFCPEQWDEYSFNLAFYDARLKVTVYKERVVYNLIEGNCMTFCHKDEKITLSVQDPTYSIAI